MVPRKQLWHEWPLWSPFMLSLHYRRDLQILPSMSGCVLLLADQCPSRRLELNEPLPLRLNLLMRKMLVCSCQSVHQALHYLLKYEIKELTEMSGSSLLSCLLWKNKFKIITSNNKALSSLQCSPLCVTERDKNLQKEKPSQRQQGLTNGLWQTLYHKGPTNTLWQPLIIRGAHKETLLRPWGQQRQGLEEFAQVP